MRVVMNPLPDLRARDLRGGGVFHQVVDAARSRCREPGLEVVHADVDVVPQARSVIAPSGTASRSAAVTLHVLALAIDLVRRRHVLVEDLLRDRHQAGMRDPGAVVAVAHLAQLVVRAPSASAASFAAGSFLIGICAAMPPIA